MANRDMTKKKKWMENNKWRWKKYNKNRKVYLKNWIANNPERKARNDNRHSWTRKVNILRAVAGDGPIECMSCHVKDPRVLQVHHVHGDGNRDPRFYREIYKKIRLNNFKEKQPLNDLEIRCANCNALAEYETGRRYPYLLGFDSQWNPIWRDVEGKKCQK